MAESVAQDRLQPALLDRLVDDEPQRKRESEEQRALTRQALRAAVLRDLGWLFNATGMGLAMNDRHHPNVARSVLNYGLPMLSGQFTSSLQRVNLEQALKSAIQQFEPRILPRTLEVQLVMEGPALDSHNRVALQIKGMLWAQPVPLEFLLRSNIDLEEGRVEMEQA